ncbi:HSF-type DNA-binding protein [Pleurostoma richardsiae]|uniref:HSF-type DNA-binding protein n=1 Tax=Pleurostoma richardsiae TaxID=41990 RepID=A0AA38VL85_9PEZI|nr:HSF-type DNA-binding protein [Pleurostoma richardsiae]
MYLSMSSPNPRKRPAPGATPVVPLPQMPQQYTAPEQMVRWNGAATNGNNYVDASGAGVNPYGMAQPQYGQSYQSPSTALARRPPNRALVPTAPRPGFESNDAWSAFGDDGVLIPQPNGPVEENDSIEMLEERALRAKREAQANRKQIPPFVQKLSSFLDESKNTDLIRWSDSGDSFIVLDEDEFAKTLIPELFKHNNYASFVRQLNMYGFHKRVGLSDNSMKASERKNKSPSEYYNPYFKRGHPNLLWLINKPKSGSNKKKGKKDEGEADSDEDNTVGDVTAPGFTQGLDPATVKPNRLALQGEVAPLQKRELAAVREQITQLQQQQKAISTLITRLRAEHNQLYQQAIMFQSMHDRHENSINAILNFLANVFRKSLEDQGGGQSVSDLLASIIPNQNQMPQGSVVDLGEFADFVQQQGPSAPNMSPQRRQQRLLPPIPVVASRAATVTPSPAASVASPPAFPTVHQQPRMGSVTEVFDTPPSDSASSNYIKRELQSNPQEGMMKIINDTNAGTTSAIDLPDVAAHTPATLSNDQRNKMLHIMSGGTSAAAPPPIPAPAPSSMPAQQPPVNSLSPIIGSSVPPPSLHDISFTQDEIDQLQRMQEDQSHKLDEISHLLGPLSPSGRIPGLDDSGNPSQSYFGDNVDIDQYLDPGAYSGGDMNFNTADYTHGNLGSADGNDFNFSLDGAGHYGHDGSLGGGNNAFEPGRVIESQTPTNNTPSEAPTEEIHRTDLVESPERDSKRRRKA